MSLEIYKLNSQISDFKIMKSKILRANEKIKELKRKSVEISIIYILSSLGIFGFFMLTNLLSSLLAIPLIFGLGIFTSEIIEKRIKKLRIQRNRNSRNLSMNEINEIIDKLDKENKTKKATQKSLEDEIGSLYENLDNIDLDASKIHSSYKYILDVYQEVINKADSSISDKELDNFINKEHAQVMPMMVKKIYERKNV